jgi:hypothetical protein
MPDPTGDPGAPDGPQGATGPRPVTPVDAKAATAPSLPTPPATAPSLPTPPATVPSLPTPPVAAVATPRRVAGPTHRRRARIARLPTVIAVVVVLVVGILVGRQGPSPAQAQPRSAVGPEAAPAAAFSSSWFCAGATDTTNGFAPGQLVITNAGSRLLEATITFVGNNRTHRTATVAVGADDRRLVSEAVPGGSPWIGAMVDLDGGAATVEQELVGSLGTATEPCATAGSTSWYFTNGATRINASSVVTLLNPYPDSATANFTFTTNEGVEAPGAFQGVDVPPDSLVAVDLGRHLRRRSRIATSVGVSAGRLVAWQTEIVSPPPKGTPFLGTRAASRPNADPASPVFGVTETLGAPSVATSWYWPQGSTAAGLDEQYTIYNPGTHTAQVKLAVSLPQGSAEPFTVSVGPEEVVPITAAGQARIPSGSTYSVSLASDNGVGVVASRTVSAQAPSVIRGIGGLLGARQPAKQWLLGAGAVSADLDEEIVLSNPGDTTVTVSAQRVASGRRQAIPGLSVRLGPGAETLWNLGAVRPAPSNALLVSGTGPIVVGSELIGRKHAAGVSLSLGVPLAP